MFQHLRHGHHGIHHGNPFACWARATPSFVNFHFIFLPMFVLNIEACLKIEQGRKDNNYVYTIVSTSLFAGFGNYPPVMVKMAILSFGDLCGAL